MEKFIELFNTFTFTEIVMVIVFTILGLKGTVELLKTIKKDLESWYQKKRGIERKDETIEQRVIQLEESDKEQMEKLNRIDDNVNKLAKFIKESTNNRNEQVNIMVEQYKKAMISTVRPTLYNLHRDFIARGHLTIAEREMFDSLVETYLSYGGNSIFKSKIIPEVEALPIQN